MVKITFKEENCKGCELCKAFCPKGIIVMGGDLNARGFHPATLLERDQCNGCTLCAVMCPDLVIEINPGAGEIH